MHHFLLIVVFFFFLQVATVASTFCGAACTSIKTLNSCNRATCSLVGMRLSLFFVFLSLSSIFDTGKFYAKHSSNILKGKQKMYGYKSCNKHQVCILQDWYIIPLNANLRFSASPTCVKKNHKKQILVRTSKHDGSKRSKWYMIIYPKVWNLKTSAQNPE